MGKFLSLVAILAIAWSACSNSTRRQASALVSTVVVSPDTPIPADGVQAATITVTVRDADGQPLPGSQVSLAVSGGGNSVVQPGPADSAGAAIGSVASTTAEPKTVVVTVDPARDAIVLETRPVITFVGNTDSVSRSASTVTANPTGGVVANGLVASTVTVTVIDVNDNPVAGAAVELQSSGASNSIVQPGLTDVDGVARGTIATTRAEVKLISATVDPGPNQVVLDQQVAVGFVGDPTTLSAATSTVAVNPSSAVVADGTASAVVTVTVRDVHGNPVAGQTVQLAATGSNNSITQPGVTTDATGVTTGTVASTTAEIKTITATVNPGPTQLLITQQPTVGFVGDPNNLSATNSSAVAAPSTAVTADGVTVSTVTVTVRDVNSNPVAAQPVQLAVTGTNNTLVQPAATDAAGTTSGTIASTTAETKTVTVTVNPGGTPLVLSTQPTIEFVGNPATISPTNTSVAVSPPTVVADGTATTTVTVTARDDLGNPVAGQFVELAATGINNSITQPGPTNPSGVATGTIASVTAQAKTITATINPGGGQVVATQQPVVTFIGNAADISATVSSASAAPTTDVVANGTATATVTVTVRDSLGNPIPGRTVQLAATGSNNTVVQPAATNASGVTTGTIASTTAETKTVTVTVDPGGTPVVLAQQPTVGFIGDAANISAAGSSASTAPTSGIIANGADVATVTVTVRDVNGNAVGGQVLGLGCTGSNNTITVAGPSASNGVTTGTIASTTAETKTITATINPGPSQVVLTTQPTATFDGDPDNVSAALSTATASPAAGVIADGTATATVSITIRDGNGNPLPGQTVQIAATGSNNTLVQPGPTDANGATTATVASTTAELKTITVTADPAGSPVVLTQQPTVGFTGDPANVSASLSTASASPSTGVIADGTDTSVITVTVRDVNSNPVVGQTIRLSPTGSDNSVSIDGVTDQSGVATGRISSTTAEIKTLTVTVNPGPSQVVLTQAPTVEFLGDPSNLSATNTSAVASPPSGVVADGTATSTITVTVRDIHGNPVSGQTVQLTSSGVNNSVAQPGATTDSGGVASGTIASTTAETKTITVTLNPGGSPIVVTTQPTVQFVGDPANVGAASSSVAASPPSGVIANGTATSTITVTVRDVNNNPVAGQTVQLAATGSGNTIVQPATTDASGVTTGTLASTTAETKTVTATVDPGGTPVVVTQQPTVGFAGDPATIDATNSGAVASPVDNVTADGTATSTITVTVRDANNNPVAGQTVQLAASGSNNTIVQPGVTDSSGVTTGTIASTTAETKTITATVDPGGTPVIVTQQPTVGFVGDPATISAANSAATASPTSVVADGVATSTITVTVRDANGNPVAGQTVELGSSGTNNSITQPVATTDANGVASGTLASTTAELKTVTATVNPGGSPVAITQQPTVTFTADPANISSTGSTVLASPTSGIAADGTATTTVTVTVLDANGNAVAGQAVQLSATGTGELITQPAVTDGNGVTTGTVASTTAETKTLTATINPGPSQVVAVQQPTVAFDPLLAIDDLSVIYGEGTVAAPLERSFDDSGSTWSAESVTAATAATVLWTVHDHRDAGWYRPGWSRRKQLTIQSSQVGGSTDLQNFPILVSLLDADIAAAAQVDGDDILFTAGNGTTKLDHQLEKYVSGSGELVAWVRIPALSPSVDTEIYLYYGNGSAGSQQNAAGVWIADFAAVYHLDGSLDGTAGEVVDSSGNAHHGQAVNAPTGGTQKIGDGQDFEAGDTDYLTIDHGGGLDFTGASATATWSGWIDFESAGGTQTLLAKGSGAPFDYRVQFGSPTNVDFGLDSSVLTTAGTVPTSGWHHVAVTWDHATMRVYIDGGADVTTLARAADLSDTTDTTTIGALGGPSEPFDGAIDEVRISSVARSAAWLATEYANQDAPAAFHLVGPEETSGSDPGVIVLGALADTGAGTNLDVLTSVGGQWSVDWTSTAIDQPEATKRGFDVAVEDVSGDALVVYSDDTETPAYRVRSAGVWSAEQTIPLNDGAGPGPDLNTGTVLWVELCARPGTDEVALAYSDTNEDLVVVVWDGAQWLTATAAALETALPTNSITSQPSNRSFDLAYAHGLLMAAWCRAASNGFWYSTKAAGQSSWSTAAQIATAPADDSQVLDLAAEPNGARIAAGVFDLGASTERLGLATWDGSAWVNAGEYDSQIRDVNDAATGDSIGAVGWVGTSGVAVCVYADAQSGTVDWVRWTAGGGWVVQTDVAVAGKGETESVALAPLRGSDGLALLVSDSNSDLYALDYDGVTWTITNAGAALETSLSSVGAVPFFVAPKRH